MKTSMVNIGILPKFRFNSILKALLISLIISIILISLTAVLLSFTPTPEWLTSTFIVLTLIISNFFGGIAATSKTRANGLVRGGASGFFYSLTLYLIGAILYNNVDNTPHTLVCLGIAVCSGAVGGVVGVNRR